MKITFHVKDRRTYKRSIVGWYREQTKKILDNKVPFYGKKLSISYGSVRIKNQKTRWGSCSKQGNLNFNLLLSALPINIIDYIIIHELFHLIEFNHSSLFWKLVQDALPTYKHCKTWLKNNGSYIQLDWGSKHSAKISWSIKVVLFSCQLILDQNKIRPSLDCRVYGYYIRDS